MAPYRGPVVTPSQLARALANLPGSARGLKGYVGDGSATEFTINHNWGTRAISVDVRRTYGDYDKVFCDVQFPSINSVKLRFIAAPANNEFEYALLNAGGV